VVRVVPKSPDGKCDEEELERAEEDRAADAGTLRAIASQCR